MVRKSFCLFILILCLGLIMAGCPKKTVVKEEPSFRKAEELAAGKGKGGKEEERKGREAREREKARIKEEESKAAQKKLKKA